MSSLKPIYLALGFVGACSLVNKFDPVNEVPASAGSAGVGGKGGAGGKGGSSAISGAAGTGDTGNGGTGGTGTGGTAGASGEGGEGGQTIQGTPITTGLVVVASNIGTGTTATHTLFLLDPKDGTKIASTTTALSVLALAYEAQRNKWFVFTGTPGQSGDTTGPLLVGTMTTAGFQQEDMEVVPKPTNQNTVAVLNGRILYRSGTHTGAAMTDDALTLLDTSATPVMAIAKLTIPYRYALAGAVGRPASGTVAGGRVFFLHQNSDDATENCVAPDAGTEQACSVYYSTLNVLAADQGTLTLPSASITNVAEVDRDGSFAVIAIQPGSNASTVAVVVPPKRVEGADARVFKYNTGTGEAISGGPVTFSLDTPPARPVVNTESISIATVALDPCNDLLFTGELANSAYLYGVPIGQTPGTVVAFDPQSKNGTVGSAVYEPFTKTLISYNNDPVNPTFNGFQIGGTATAPTATLRGKNGAAVWTPPTGIVPSIVVAQNPNNPPCN